MTQTEPDPESPPLATERQRAALLHWGIARDRVEDPGLTRSEASKWLGALISSAKRRENGGKEETRARVPPLNEPPLPLPTDASPIPRGGLGASAPTEPQALEVELTIPTGIPSAGIRLRTRADRKPGETLIQLGDRLTDELVLIAQREAERVEQVLRAPRSPSLTRSGAKEGTLPREDWA